MQGLLLAVSLDLMAKATGSHYKMAAWRSQNFTASLRKPEIWIWYKRKNRKINKTSLFFFHLDIVYPNRPNPLASKGLA